MSTVDSCSSSTSLTGSHFPFVFHGGPTRVHLTVCTVDFTVFTVAVTVFLTFIFLNFESENTGYRYR